MTTPESEHHVSTESQRLALDAMSAQLVHKLNAMISEQQERARLFAEQHHSSLPIPQQFTPTVPVSPPPPAAEPAPSIAPPPRHKPVPPPPATRKPALQQEWKLDYPQPPAPVRPPVRSTPKKKTGKDEEGNIGAGTIITIIIVVIILMRACA